MSIEEKCLQTIRVLACEMIQRAKSGHPGIVLGAAKAVMLDDKPNTVTNNVVIILFFIW